VLALVLACSLAPSARAAPPEDEPPESDDAPACDPESDEACEPPESPEPKTAGEWYARGYELGNAGDFPAAAAAFLRSYELQPTPEALFNAALAYENAGATIEAIRTYKRFLAEPERTQTLVPAAERSIDALMREVAVLKGVRYDPERAPAKLLIQGEPVELDAFPLLVLPGEIEVEVVDAAGKHAREFYELDAGESLVVDLRALLPPPPEPPEPELIVDEGPSQAELEAARARARRGRTLRKITWAGLGLSGAGAVAAATFGGLALREKRLFEDATCFEFEGGVCPPDHPIGDPGLHSRSYTRYVLAGTITAGVSAGVAVTSAIIGLVSLRYDRPRARSGGRASVRIVPGPGLINLRF
jgi:tetratricopeptide (TPR) repeat protein